MQCPQCKNEVPVTEAHYGALYTCPRCMAVYFINFDGAPEYEENPPLTTNFEEVSTEVPPTEFSSPAKSDEAPPLEFQPTEVAEEEALLPSLQDPIEPSSVSSAAEVITGTDFLTAVREITDYGNQEETISQINYDLFIKGLDTKEIRQSFKEAVDDSKFGWLTVDLMEQIKNGQIALKNLNPIQAFVLAQRVQFLDLEIEWKQNVAF